MPGEYDFNGIPELSPVNYVDYIGLSSNPYNTVLRNSSIGWVIRDGGANDYGLENVYLPGDGRCYSESNTYARWNNIIIGGLTFDANENSWPDIKGEFRNINILPSADAFFAVNSIDGIFENIYGQGLNSIFRAGNSINGTFSNIFTDGITGDSFKSVASIDGYFENIEIYNSPITIFDSRGINGKFRNLKFKSVNQIFVPGITGMVDVDFDGVIGIDCQNILTSISSVS